MRNLRTGFSLMCLLASPLFAAPEGHSGPAVLVIASLAVEAHRLAIEGIQMALATSPSEIRILDVSQANNEGSGRPLAASPVRVVIAVGSEAIRVVESMRLEVPVIYAMILNRRLGGDAKAWRATVTIPLGVSLPSLLAHLKPLFPGKTRLGIILNPASSGMSAMQLQARAQQLGFTVRAVECTGAEQLLAALASLKGRVDFVWCLPDGTLYNSATVKPLILASIENRLPLIGFSESFAKAGAAVGVYPDFRDIGAQAGEAARQLLQGQAVRSPEEPRRLKVAVNQSVLRLFGLRYAPAATEAGEVLVLP